MFYFRFDQLPDGEYRVKDRDAPPIYRDRDSTYDCYIGSRFRTIIHCETRRHTFVTFYFGGTIGLKEKILDC